MLRKRCSPLLSPPATCLMAMSMATRHEHECKQKPKTMQATPECKKMTKTTTTTTTRITKGQCQCGKAHEDDKRPPPMWQAARGRGLAIANMANCTRSRLAWLGHCQCQNPAKMQQTYQQSANPATKWSMCRLFPNMLHVLIAHVQVAVQDEYL
jgi:hypothetical protein